MRYVIIGIIKLYQRISQLFFSSPCRFHPSCSHYAIEAMEHYGIYKGLTKACWRVVRCSPFSQGGYDPLR